MFTKKSLKKQSNLKDPYWFQHISGDLADNKVLGICVHNWVGVRHATEQQCSDILLIEKISDEKHALKIYEFVKEKGFQKIAINGLPDNLEILIKIFHQQDKNIKIFVVIHGSFTQQTNEHDILEKLNKIYPFDYIEKFGFTRKGMEDIFTRLGTKAEFLPNYISLFPSVNAVKTINQKKISRIGILSRFHLYKNNLNQVLAACLIKNSTVHVLDLPEIDYLKKITDDKIVKHSQLPSEKFLGLLQKMDINCYVSISECYPMVFLESMCLGVPCLLGKTSEFIVENEPEIKKYLLVENPEDIFEIKEKIEQIIENYATVNALCQNFIVRLLEKNRKMILKFFNA